MEDLQPLIKEIQSHLEQVSGGLLNIRSLRIKEDQDRSKERADFGKEKNLHQELLVQMKNEIAVLNSECSKAREELSKTRSEQENERNLTEIKRQECIKLEQETRARASAFAELESRLKARWNIVFPHNDINL